MPLFFFTCHVSRVTYHAFTGKGIISGLDLHPLRTRLKDLFRTARDEYLEVLDVACSQCVILHPVLVLVPPCRRRIEHIIRYIRACERNLESEDLVFPEFYIVEFAVEYRIEHVPGVTDADALSYAELAADPAGVHQPDLGAVLLDLPAQQVCIVVRMMHHKGGPEACAEGDLRLDP